jgi:two-component system, chemotaxis family, CheB/CheR fusion protein
MSKENRAKIKQRIEKVLVNKSKVLNDAYTKSLEELVEELKSYQIELEFQNEELERIQEELLNSRDAYQQLYQHAPVGYVIVDDKFRLKKFNKTFEGFFKLENNLTEGFDFRKLIKPHDQNRFYSFARKLMKEGEAESVELAFQSKVRGAFYLAVNGNLEQAAEGIRYRLTLLDISEQKAIEEKLNRSEKHYRSLFHGSKDALLVLDFHTRKFVAVNEQAVALFGAENEEHMLQLGPAELSPKLQDNDLPSADYSMKMMETAINKGSHLFEWKHKRLDGALFDASVLLTAFEMDGQTLLQTTVRDITERKIADEKLAETSAYLENLINYANAPIIVWDSKLSITRFNKAFEKLSGYQAENILGENLSTLFPNDKVEDIIDLIEATAKGQRLESVEIEILCADNTRKIALWNSANILNEFGETVSTIAQGQDITQRLEAENIIRQRSQMIQLLLDSTAEGICGVDENGQCTFVNKSAITMLSYEKEEAVLGRNLHDIMHHTQEDGQNHALDVCAIHKAFLRAQKSHSDDEVFWRADGSSFPVEYWSYPIEQEGKILGAVITFIDISERKQSENKLKALNKSLTDANQTKDKLFSIISHDLRSPAAAVLGLASLLQENYDSLQTDEVKRIGKSIYSSADNLSELLDNLLEWSRLQSGTTAAELKQESVGELINSVFENLRQMAELKKILVAVHVEEQLTAYFDKRMMASVIQNLMSNAIKFTPRGGKVIIMASKHNDEMIAIQVIDTGIGIPQSIMDELFVVNNSKGRLGTDGERSSGLGLILCHEFVQMHRGSINVQSKEGKGSTFKVLLPVKPE